MGIVVNQSVKGTIVSYVGAFIGFLNVMFIMPYCLPPDIVGFNKIFLDTAVLFTFIAQMGLSSAMIRFFPYFKDSQTANGLFGLVLIAPLAGFILLTIVTLLFYHPIISLFETNSALFANNFYFVLPLTFFLMYLGLFETYSNCLYRVVVPKIIRDVLLRLLNVGIIILFYFKIINFKLFIILLIAIYGISTILNLIYLSRITKLSLKIDLSNIPPRIRKDFINYVIFILFVGIGSNIVSKVDVFMISSSINLNSTGIFSIAFYIISVIEIPSRVFLQVLNPTIAQAWKDNDLPKIEDIYKKSSLNQFIVGGFILLLIWINIDNIFALMPNGEVYQAGKYVVLLLGLGKVFDMVTGINWFIIANSNFYYFQLIFMSYLTVVTVALNALLIPRYGIIGAGLTSFLALSSYNVLLVIFLKRKINIWPFSTNTIKVAALFLCLFLLNAAFPHMGHPIIDACIRTFIIGGIFIAIAWHFKLSDDFIALINNMLIRVNKKLKL
jgi:O-antigen/teichoic acid export membrane protein